jgi:hypothetical protein
VSGEKDDGPLKILALEHALDVQSVQDRHGHIQHDAPRHGDVVLCEKRFLTKNTL